MNKKQNKAVTARKAHSLKRLFAFESLERRTLLAGLYETTVLADSPVAYWRLGEPSSATTFADISGNGLSGTRTGGTFGEAGAIVNDADTSARFTSVGTGLQVNDNNLLTPPGNAATFEAWIRPDSYGGSYQNIISKRSITNGFEYTFVLEPASGRLHFNANYSGGGIQSVVISNAQVALNQWQHVAATVGNGTVRIYLNGAEVATGSSGIFQNTTAPVVIGQTPGEPGAFQFFGRIDEVAIYPTTLSAIRIAAHYHAGVAVLTGDYQTTILADIPTAYWRLGEANSTSSIADSSGNGFVGSRAGGTFGQAGALADDPNTSALNVGSVVAHNTLLAPGTTATFEAWIKPNNAGNGTWQNIISKRSDPGFFEYGLVISPAGRLHFNALYANGGGSVESASPVVSGQWQHVAATFESGIVRLYLNGVQVGVGANNGTFQNTGRPVVIGFVPFGDNQFQGVMDEVAFYRTALPQSRIIAHYLDGTNFKPTDISLSSQSIVENQPAGTVVGALNSSDTIGNTHTYALVPGSGDDDNAKFEIVGNQLRTVAPINVTETTDFTVRVRTTDQGQRSFEKAFTISVEDEPTFHKHINVVGKLRGPGDIPLPGTHSVQFSLYDVASGGSPFWSATNSTVNVEGVPGGHFQQDLAELANLFGQIPSSGNVYLAISIDGNVATDRIRLDGDLATVAAGSVTLRDVMVSSSTRNGDDKTYALRALGNLRNFNNGPVIGTFSWTAELFSASTGGFALYSESGQFTISDSIGGSFGIAFDATHPQLRSLLSGIDDVWVQWTIDGELFTDRIKIDGGEASSSSSSYRLVSGQATRSFDIEDKTQYGPDTLNVWTLFQDSQTGLPLTGNHSVTYSVFDSSTGGTAIFSETASIAIQDSIYGSYVHALGSITPLDFGMLRDIDNLWIELSIDGMSSSLPRTSLQTAPFFARAAVDQTPPVVASTSFVMSGTLPANATSTSITFNEPVLSANIATTYELRRAGADGLLGNGDDPIINLSSVTMAGNTATLNFAALTEDVYRLTVKDTITDVAGNSLDGDSNGTAGGNWRKDFVVGALTTPLTSPNGFEFDPEFGGVGAGQLVQGTSNAFDGAGRLFVGNTSYSSPPPTVSGVFAFQVTPSTGRFTTSSSSFVDVPGMSLTINTSGNPVHLSTPLLTNVSGTSGRPNARFRYVVDGVARPSSYQETRTTDSWDYLTYEDLLVGLSAGSHTIKLQVMVSGGTVQIAGGAGDPDFASQYLRAFELTTSAVAVHQVTPSTGRFTTSSSSFVDVPGMSLTINTSGNPVHLSTPLLTNVSGTSGRPNARFRYVVDGVARPSSYQETRTTDSWDYLTYEDLLVGLSAGSHTIKLQVMVSGGTVQIAGGAGDPDFASQYLRAFELTTSAVAVHQVTPSTGRFTTSSSSFVDVPGMSLTINTSGNPVHLSTPLLTNVSGTSGRPNARFRYVVDGVARPSSYQETRTTDSWDYLTYEDLLVGLSAGSHTIKLQVMVSGGTVQIAGGAGDPDFASQYLRAFEYLSIPTPIEFDNGQTIGLTSTSIANMTVSREVTVPANSIHDFARTVDTFTNSTGSPITAPVRVVGNLGSDAGTTVFATSDGDLIVEPTDLWFGTDDADGTGTPAIIHLLHGPFGLQPTSVNVIEDNVEWTYDLTVPAGATKRLAHFTVLGTTRAEAIAAANALVTANGFGGQAAAFLTNDELASLANFQFNTAPTDLAINQSSVAENLPAGSTVGSLSSVDANPGDQFVYTLVSGSGDTDNSSFIIDAGLLKTDAVFNYEAKNSYTIRVRSTDLGGLSVEKQLTITIENVLERTAPVQIGDGTTQRSVVNKLVVSFDQAIEFDAGAFQVYQRVKDSNNALVLVPVTTNVALAATAGGMTATLTFSGSMTRAGTNALVDGNYQLTINGGLIRTLNTTKTFDADGDGNGGGLYTMGNQAADNFFALLGDANGNGEVDAQDLLGAKLALRKTIGQAGYNSAYDINGNGVIDAQDILNIQLNLRKKRVFF